MPFPPEQGLSGWQAGSLSLIMLVCEAFLPGCFIIKSFSNQLYANFAENYIQFVVKLYLLLKT